MCERVGGGEGRYNFIFGENIYTCNKKFNLILLEYIVMMISPRYTSILAPWRLKVDTPVPMLRGIDDLQLAKIQLFLITRTITILWKWYMGNGYKSPKCWPIWLQNWCWRLLNHLNFTIILSNQNFLPDLNYELYRNIELIFLCLRYN